MKFDILKWIIRGAIIILFIHLVLAADTYYDPDVGIGRFPSGTFDINSSPGGLCIDGDCITSWNNLFQGIQCTQVDSDAPISDAAPLDGAAHKTTVDCSDYGPEYFIMYWEVTGGPGPTYYGGFNVSCCTYVP